MLKPGDYLIPEKYQYCYEVEKISLTGWWPKDHIHVACIRWDIDENRNPVRKHRGNGFIVILKGIGDGLYTSDNPYGGILRFKTHQPEQFDLFIDQYENSY